MTFLSINFLIKVTFNDHYYLFLIIDDSPLLSPKLFPLNKLASYQDYNTPKKFAIKANNDALDGFNDLQMSSNSRRNVYLYQTPKSKSNKKQQWFEVKVEENTDEELTSNDSKEIDTGKQSRDWRAESECVAFEAAKPKKQKRYQKVVQRLYP